MSAYVPDGLLLPGVLVRGGGGPGFWLPSWTVRAPEVVLGSARLGSES